jgi:peptide-methionine (S)-S-oxide reductase
MKKIFALFALMFIGYWTNPVFANDGKKTDSIVLSAGCFWCMQAAYERLPGVIHVTAGYAGGDKANPTYEQVATGATGHAESVLVEFDPQKITLNQLLDFFWKSFDPTDPRGVDPDFGPEYRTQILYSNDQQKQIALASKEVIQKKYTKPIVTVIKPLTRFWPAEAYHQDYAQSHPNEPYIRFETNPKLERLGVSNKPIVAQPR